MKMYILVADDISAGFAINSACHAAVACTLKFQETPEVKEWLSGPFKKVTCKVPREDILRAAALEKDNVVITESALDNIVTAIAFKPKEEFHRDFKRFSLYK